MSEEYITPPPGARNGSSSGGGQRSRPDNPRTVVMVLTEKPRMVTGEDGKPKGVKIGVTPTYEERRAAEKAGIALGRYDRIGKWSNETAVFKGQVLSPIAGRIPGFAEVEGVPEAEKGKGVILNGEMHYPTGEPIEVLMPVGKNAQKLSSFKVGGVAVLEDVSLRAPALPNVKGHEAANALVPVPNDKASIKGAYLVSCSDGYRVRSKEDEDKIRNKVARTWQEILKDGLGGFFHIGPNAKTADERLSFLGHTMVTPTLWEAKKREGDAENAAPIMMGGINGAMGIRVDVENAYQAGSVEEIVGFAQQWQDHLRDQGSSAYAGCIVQLFRKPVDAKTGEMLDEAQTQAMFDRMRANGLEPQQAFTFVANDVKDAATGEWRQRTAAEALEAVLSNQEKNVALMHARMADGTLGANERIKAQSLRSLIDGGLWSVVVVPAQAWNVAKSIKDNVASGRFDPLDNWRSQVALPGSRKVSEKGNVVVHDAMMAYSVVHPGKLGSFRPPEGEAPKDTAFAGVPGIRQGYLEVLEVEGGHTMVDARPMDKQGEIAVPPRLLVTGFTPPEHMADMQAQIAQLGANARAVEFGSVARRSGPAPQATPEATPAPADEPSGPKP